MINKKLEDCLEYIQPTKYIVSSERYSDEFSIPVLTAGKSFILGYTNETDGIFRANKENPVILFDDFTTDIKWVDFPFKVKSSACKILIPKEGCNIRYLYYAMKSIQFNHSDHKRYWISTYSKLAIRVGNISEMERIVNKLDSISDLIDIKEKQILELNELVKSRFIEMFGNNVGDLNFSDVLVDKTKEGYKFDSTNYLKAGEIAIIDQGKDLICGFKSKEKDKIPYEKECIIFGDHTEIFKFINFPIYLGADGTKILLVKEDFDTRFVYEFLSIHYVKVGGYSRHFKFLKEQRFLKPDIKKQKEFRLFCEQIDKLISIVQSQINDLQELLDKKMDEYFG